jgi:hypothetical protein
MALARRQAHPLSTPNPQSLGAKRKGSEWFGRRDQSHIGIRSIEGWRRFLFAPGFEIARDGSDTLWDAPYARRFPNIFPRLVFAGSAQMIAVVFTWTLGKNYVCFATGASV